VARYNNITEGVEEEEEKGVSNNVAEVSVSEAITAIKTLKLYKEQRDKPIHQVFMAQLRREQRDLESKRANSAVQSILS
jgi:hypothetical protein